VSVSEVELLLKRDRLGNVVAGADERLLARAARGDDIVAYEESSIFSCHILFANYVVSADRVSGLSLLHLAFGDLADLGRLEREPIDIIQYIYDSRCKNLLCRDLLDQDRTVTELFANNPHYASFSWYSTRRFADLKEADANRLKSLGDQFKIRLTFAADLAMIVKPDIVFFPEAGRDFLVKSAAMILPTDFACDPIKYAQTDRPMVANKAFSLAFINIGADGLLTIVYKQRFSAQESLERSLARSFVPSEPTPRFVGHQDRQNDADARATRLACDYTILAPQALV
jgi:hypothetical protein